MGGSLGVFLQERRCDVDRMPGWHPSYHCQGLRRRLHRINSPKLESDPDFSACPWLARQPFVVGVTQGGDQLFAQLAHGHGKDAVVDGFV